MVLSATAAHDDGVLVSGPQISAFLQPETLPSIYLRGVRVERLTGIAYASSSHRGQIVAVNGLDRKPLGPVKDFVQLELLPGFYFLGVGVNRVRGSASPVNGGQVPPVSCLNALVLRRRRRPLRQPEFFPTRIKPEALYVSSHSEIGRRIPGRPMLGPRRDVGPFNERLYSEFAW